ncbi:MAG: acyl-CoA dehydrogenase family protein [Gammaproteobacteria bacterium]|nr:acyl-CoA dehydrogenase family protein [Gammaproteobacteria bacterium]
MDFTLSEQMRQLFETVERFIANELQPLEEDIERTGVLDPQLARQVFERSRALGLYAVNMPESLGGGGLSAVETCLLEEKFAATSDILIRRAFGNVYEALLLCDAEQSLRWLEPTVRGERTCSIAITEPGAGSDAASIRTRAAPDGDGWRLTGSKHFISDGLFSDYFIVSAVSDPGAGARGISLFLVDKSLPGVSVGRDQPMMGLRGTSHIELNFDAVPLEAMCLLGEAGRGLRIILQTLGRVRLAHIGARAVGKSMRAFELMLAYARQREQFGQPIGEFQLVQQMLADSALDIETARLLVLKAAWLLDQGGEAREHIAMAKVYAAEALGRVVDRCVQVHGGLGYCKDLAVERLYRDARIFRIYDGTSEIHRLAIARGLLKNGAQMLSPGH